MYLPLQAEKKLFIREVAFSKTCPSYFSPSLSRVLLKLIMPILLFLLADHKTEYKKKQGNCGCTQQPRTQLHVWSGSFVVGNIWKWEPNWNSMQTTTWIVTAQATYSHHELESLGVEHTQMEFCFRTSSRKKANFTELAGKHLQSLPHILVPASLGT